MASQCFSIPFSPSRWLTELAMLWQDEVLCDVTIHIEDQQLKAHKVVLASAIPYFKTMYTSSFDDKDLSHVTLQNQSAAAMRTILSAVYRTELRLDADNLCDVVILADYLRMAGIVEDCIAFLRQHLDEIITPERCVRYLQFAELYSLPDVVTFCDRIVLNQLCDASNRDCFKALTQQQLLRYLAADELLCSNEMQVYETALQWLACSDDRTPLASSILGEVRFGAAGFTLQQLQDLQATALFQDSSERMVLIKRAIDFKAASTVEQERLKATWNRRRGKHSLVLFRNGTSGSSLPTITCVPLSSPNDQLSQLDMSKTLPTDCPYHAIFRSQHVVQVDNSCYISGGYLFDTKKMINHFHHWDFDNMSHRCLAPMLTSRTGHVSFLTNTNQIVVAGGYGQNGEDGVSVLDSVEVYDLSSNEWRTGQPLSKPLAHAASCSVNGAGFITGGYNTTAVADTQLYDATTKQWNAKASMLKARHSHSMVSCKNKVFVFDASYPLAVEEYNIAADQWTHVSVNLPRNVFGVKLSESEIFLIGTGTSTYLDLYSFGPDTHEITQLKRVKNKGDIILNSAMAVTTQLLDMSEYWQKY